MWQRAIEQVLQGISGVQCLLDDIIVMGPNDKEHRKNLNAVFQQLNDYGRQVNKNKYKFFEDRIEYCGHEIDRHGLHKTKSKIDAVLNCKQPANVTELKSFLGLVNYYYRFLPNLASTLQPLYELLKSGSPCKWTSHCNQSFEKVKENLVSDNVLAHYDLNLPLNLACDALQAGLGAVLSHVMPNGTECPIAFASRTLNKAETNYYQIDKETLTIIWAVKKFSCYLYRRHFSIITDHQPLTAIFHPSKNIPATSAARLQRYAIFLSGHNQPIAFSTDRLETMVMLTASRDCQINFCSNVVGEELPDKIDLFYNSHLELLPVTQKSIANSTRKDSVLAGVLNSALTGDRYDAPDLVPYFSRRNEISVNQGCLVWGLRVIVPSDFREKFCMNCTRVTRE